MKNPSTGTNTSSRQSWTGIIQRFVQRRNLALRGEERYREAPRLSAKAAMNMAEQLQLLEQQIASIPVVDIQHRNAVRNAIASGAYVINPVSIAEKFLKFEKDLYR